MNFDVIAKYAFVTENVCGQDAKFKIAEEMILRAAAENDYDTAVAVFTMCMNKSLNDLMAAVDINSDDFYGEVDMAARLFQHDAQEWIKVLGEKIKATDSDTFIRYISYILICNMNAFNRHGSDNSGYWNRAEYIYDRMLGIIPEYQYGSFKNNTELENFTKYYRIQIPYLYAYVFDKEAYCCMKRFKNDNSIEDNLSNFTGGYIHDILTKLIIETERLKQKSGLDCLHLNCISYNVGEESAEDCQRENIGFNNEPIPDIRKIDFSKYLPVNLTKHDMPKYYNHLQKAVYKEWYRSVPFVPYYSEEKTEIFKSRSETLKDLMPYLKRLYDYEQYNERLVKEKNKAIEAKNSVINDFSHTYSNMSATTLGDIADTLLSLDSDYFKYQGRRIMTEYIIKENLSREVELLKLRHEDNDKNLVKAIINSVNSEGVSKIGIEDIISDSLKRCFMTLFFGKNVKSTELRKLFFGRKLDEEEEQEYIDAFECYVIVAEDRQAALNWNSNEDLIKLNISMSPWWKNMELADREYAALVLTELITELFNNLFKYGKISEPVTLAFGERSGLLTIKMTNQKKTDSTGYGTKVGITSKESFICKLNAYFGYNEKPVTISDTDTDYAIEILMAKGILSGEEI